MSHFLPLLSIAAFLLGCAGVFRNPDLAPGASTVFMPFHRIALPEISNEEERIYGQQGDTGVIRIPEHDFFWMQGNMLCLIARFHRSDTVCDPALFTAYKKDITRREELYTPEFTPDTLLDPLKQYALNLYALDNCPEQLLRALIINDLPVLIHGTLLYKKRLTNSPGDPTHILRKIQTFDIVYGYSRMTGPSQYMPGEGGDEYLFEMRSRRNFKAKEGAGIINHALTPYGAVPIGSNWLMERIYIVLPGQRNFDEFWKKVGETVLKLDYQAPLPVPKKVF